MERQALALLLLLLLDAASAQTHFSVVAARRVRPNSEYPVAVSFWGGEQPASVFVELSARLDSGRSFSASETVLVEPGTTRLARLRVGDEGSGSYRLLARAAGEAPFVDSAPLDYEARRHSLLIQTDRAVYRPGAIIRFRCLVLDSRLRPPSDARLQLHIADGQGNRIQQWNEPKLQQGVFSGELQLSPSPVLGDWQIVASLGDDSAKKLVHVAEYVLPRFEVSIDAPAHATFKQGKISVTVRAKYNNGKPVRGELTVAAFPDIYSSLIQPIYQVPQRKSLKIRGTATLEFDMVQELGVTDDDYARPVVIEAAVEEEVSGRRQNSSLRITLYKHSHRMELLRSAEHYKPGLKYSALLRVSRHDGTPVRDRDQPVLVSYGFGQQLSNNVTRTLDEQGEVQLDFFPPPGDEAGHQPLRIEAHYLDLHERFPETSAASSGSDSYLQATLLTPRPKVGEMLRVEVNCTRPLQQLSYQLFGRGQLLDAASVPVTEGHSASFQFLASPTMAPVAQLLVYFVRPDGELVADSLELRLDGALQNFLEVRPLSEQLGPGDSLELSISAKPNSFVGLMAVDQNSVLLRSGNDITRDRVRRELMSYDGTASEAAEDGQDGEELAWIRSGSAGSAQAFRRVGSVVLTNGYVHGDALQPTEEEANRVRDPKQALSISTIRPDIGPPIKYKFPTRPGWAGRWAFSYVPLTNWKPRVFLMHDISDTWLFSNVSAGQDGKTVIRRTVPDSITSWVLTGFSVDAASGLGLMEAPTKLRVSKAFFISLDLPPSVIRGEMVAIPIVVFNNMARELLVEVVLENSGDFEFAEASKQADGSKRLELYRTQKLLVAGNSVESVSFVIVPTKLNHIAIKAKATSALAGDSAERLLLVRAEGETQQRNRALFVDLRRREGAAASLPLDFPRHLVEDSEHVELSASGDPLGASIPNLSRLLHAPVDCGEQNVLALAANVVALEYLSGAGRLTPALQRRAEEQLRASYQQQLTYRHADGSFSAFGRADPGGSTWLTAHAARWLGRARAWIHVDERVVTAALDWLVSRQAPDGGFAEVGPVLRVDAQTRPALSAFVLAGLLEAGGAGRRESVRRAAERVARSLTELAREDVYALALSCYALGLARSEHEDEAFRRLQAGASVDATRGLRWWERPRPDGDPGPRATDVEATAYALLCYVRRGLLPEALDIMRWLLEHRNSRGGLVSTQDTVVGLLALSKLGQELSSSHYDLTISVRTDQAELKDIRINSQNFMVVQKHVLLGKTRVVNITASGSGFAFVQLSSRYNLNVTGAQPRFALDPQVDAVSTPEHLQLSVCSSFLPNREANESNMAVMEVSLPSGFSVDRDALSGLELSQHVKRVESRQADGTLVLYFDKMGRQDYCPTVSAYRSHKLAKQRPVPVSVYDYYEPSRRARVFYEARTSALCDICEGQQCGDACRISADKRLRDSQPSTSSSCRMLAALPLLLLPVLSTAACHLFPTVLS